MHTELEPAVSSPLHLDTWLDKGYCLAFCSDASLAIGIKENRIRFYFLCVVFTIIHQLSWYSWKPDSSSINTSIFYDSISTCYIVYIRVFQARRFSNPWMLCRYRAKFNDLLNLMTPIWRRGGGRQGVYLACVGAMTTRGGVIRGSVWCLNLYTWLRIFFAYG